MMEKFCEKCVGAPYCAIPSNFERAKDSVKYAGHRLIRSLCFPFIEMPKSVQEEITQYRDDQIETRARKVAECAIRQQLVLSSERV